jgi:hypothetical protein
LERATGIEPTTFSLGSHFLDTVTADGGRDEYFDMGEDGLMLRVSCEGTKSFAFRYRRKSDGRCTFVSLGRYPDVSLEAARLAAVKARIAVAEGGAPAHGVQLRKTAPTFKQVVENWTAGHAMANRTARVRADDQSMLTRYVLPSIGAMKVQDIGRREITLSTISAERPLRGWPDSASARTRSR